MTSFLSRSRAVPAWMHEFLGERTTYADCSLALVFGFAFPVILALVFPSDFAVMGGWRRVLFCVSAADIAAGAVANTSPGTEAHHYGKSLAFRHVFVTIHFLHLIGVGYPLADAPGVFEFLVKTYGLTLMSAVVVLNAGRVQRPVAMAALTVAVPLLLVGDCGRDILRPIALVFVMKLVLSYSVAHQQPADVSSRQSALKR